MINVKVKLYVNQISYIVPKHHMFGQLVEALCYKLEGRGYESRLRRWDFFFRLSL